MKISKQALLIVGVLAISVCGLLGYYLMTQQNSVDKEDLEETTSIIIIEPREVTFQVIEGTTAVATKQSGLKEDEQIDDIRYSYSGQLPMATIEYIAYEDSIKQFTSHPNEIDSTVEVEKSLLHVYKRDGNEIVEAKEIDMKQALADHNSDYAPYMTDGMLLIDGKSYVKINLYDKSVDKYGKRWIYLGIEDNDVIEDLTGKDTSQDRYYDVDSNILLSKYTNLPEKYIGEYTMRVGCVYFSVNPITLTSGFLESFPEMKEFFSLDEGERATIHFPDITIPVETIAKWFMPVGTDMYEDLILYGEYSKDGQDHEIHSLEEFREWFKDTEE